MYRSVTVRRESWPLQGVFRISRGARTESEVIVVEIAGDDVAGMGECFPYKRYGETLDSVAAQIESVAGELANGMDRAGLAAAFQAPLGMAIFAVEILYSGMVFESEALIFTIIASVTAYAVHGAVVGWEPLFAVPPGLSLDAPVELVGYVVLGVAAGLVGVLVGAGLVALVLPGGPEVSIYQQGAFSCAVDGGQAHHRADEGNGVRAGHLGHVHGAGRLGGRVVGARAERAEKTRCIRSWPGILPRAPAAMPPACARRTSLQG